MKETRSSGIFSVAADLIKFKLSFAVTFSSVAGYYLCSNIADIRLLFLACGVFLLASGSAVLNQYTETKTDAMMDRTRNRPIPSGKVSGRTAILITMLFFISGSLFLYINGPVPLALGITSVILYNVIYTRLKKSTILSIVPGALVGALPPMIGFTSAGGDFTEARILAFSAFMFMWQLPHFWLIIIKYSKDYQAAGFPTIAKYMNELQIRYLVFFWVLFTTVFLFFFFYITEALNVNMSVLLILTNFSFIIVFYRLLFLKSATREIKSAFILINSFSLLMMLLLITFSIMKGI
jgi:heme o synthase